MKRWIYILPFVVLALVSCRRGDFPCAETGSFSVVFRAGEIQTRAVSPGDGVVGDGGGVYGADKGTPDLLILVANSSTGSIVARYPDDDVSSGPSAVLQAAPSVTDMAVVFGDLEAGEYKVYAFANTEGYWDMNQQLSDISSASEAEDLYFNETPPSLKNSRLPLSAKGTVTVSAAGNGSISLQLLRPVAKVGVTFVNLTEKEIKLTDCSLTLKNMSPTQGYVLPHGDSDTCGISRDLLFSSESVSIGIDEVPDSTNEAPIGDPQFVYPSASAYTCDVSFSYKVGEDGEAKSYSTTGMAVHNRISEEIRTLSRNQYLKLRITITDRHEMSIWFEVEDWNECPNNIIFY